MASSRSFYVDALILGKHGHHQQQQQQEDDDMMLNLPLLHQSLPRLSHSTFSLYPFIAGGASTSPGVRRGIETAAARLSSPLSCLATATALPTCLCPFCLPLASTADTPASGSPTHERQQHTSNGSDHIQTTAPSTVQRRGWQPWLHQASAAESQLLASTPTKNELADRLQNQHLIFTGLQCVSYLCLNCACV